MAADAALKAMRRSTSELSVSCDSTVARRWAGGGVVSRHMRNCRSSNRLRSCATVGDSGVVGPATPSEESVEISVAISVGGSVDEVSNENDIDDGIPIGGTATGLAAGGREVSTTRTP